MIRWAYQNEEIKSVPPFPKMRMGESPEIEYLTLDQQEKVLAHIPPQDAPVFRFAMEYGLRVGEVRALKRDVIKDGKIYIRRAFSENELTERTKTGDIRNPALMPYAKEIIDGLTHLGPFLFVRQNCGREFRRKLLISLSIMVEAASITFSAYLSVFLTLSNIKTFWIPPKIPPYFQFS
jgi:integrase